MVDEYEPFTQVSIEGVDVSSNVVEVDIEDHDGLIDKVEIVLLDPGEFTSELPREGQRVVVDLGWQEEHAVLFEGVVSEACVRARGAGQQQVQLTAYDLSYLLKRRTPTPTNHVGPLSTILREIVERDPSTGIVVGQIEPDPDPEFDDRQPLRQTGQSDWDLIAEMAARYRSRAFVEYNEGASRFYFLPVARLVGVDPVGRLSYCGNSGRLIEFEYERVASTADPQRTAVISDPTTGSTLTEAAGERADEQPAELSSQAIDEGGDMLSQALDTTSQAVNTPTQQRPAGLVQGLPSDPGLATSLAVDDASRLHGLRGRGRAVGSVLLRAKSIVEIEGVASWASGPWYVRQVNHVVARPGSRRDHTTYRCMFEVTR